MINYRGERHQSLTPIRVPQFEVIIRNFLTKRDPLDKTLPPDYAIDKVVKLNLFDDSFQNLEEVCKELSWDVPAQEQLDKLFLKVEEEKPESFKYTSVKKIKVRYYAIRINDDIISFLDSCFQKRQEDVTFWENAKAHISFDKVFHITLAYKDVHKQEYSFYDKNQTELLQKKIQEITMAKVVWDENAIAIQVQLPTNVQCGNKFPHITIATLKESVESYYSNKLLESSPQTQFEVKEQISGTIDSFW